MLEVKLIYENDDLGKAWQKDFHLFPEVKILKEDITKSDCNAIVSPANSFGFMDGGLDFQLSERFGWDLEKKLQELIRKSSLGELLIGDFLVLETGDKAVPYLISAPTMRVPMSFNIATSVNAYLAMKAILIAAREHKNIHSVAIPGLCTGCGRMPAHIASKQMFMAYKEVIKGEKQDFTTFGMAQKFQNELNEDGLIWDF